MRIGIVTHWMSVDNYGGMLQTFALQRYLCDLGHDAYIIRFYISGPSNIPQMVRKIGQSLKIIKSYLFEGTEHRYEYHQKKTWNTMRNFDEFRKQYIALTPNSYNSLKEIQNKYPDADLYITGSDQVWACDLTNHNNWIFYLDFGDKKTKRISYAASFGFSYFPGKDEVKFKELLDNFDAISVRETNGKEICKKYGFDAVRSVDSTMLLPPKIYIDMMAPCKHNKQFAFFYSVNVSYPEEIYWRKIKSILDAKNLEIIITTGSGYNSAKEIFEDVTYDYATVEEWLSNIYYSEIVLTASFHGVVFALMLQKDFIYLPLKGKAGEGNNRIIDLLKSVGLESRLVRTAEDLDAILNNHIDYTKLQDAKLQCLVANSCDYLKKAINI